MTEHVQCVGSRSTDQLRSTITLKTLSRYMGTTVLPSLSGLIDPNSGFRKWDDHVAEHWERPRHPDGKFKKTLRETDAPTEFRKNMEAVGAVTRFTNLADAVAQMQAEHFEAQQRVERLQAVIDIQNTTIANQKTRITDLEQEKRTLTGQLKNSENFGLTRMRENEALRKSLADYTAQEGLPSRLRRATEQLDETRAVLLRQVNAIDKVIHPEG